MSEEGETSVGAGKGGKDVPDWTNFANWIHCICIVTFDLELGQAIESIHPPHISLTKQELMNICYLAFPDSNSGCMGDTLFTVRLKQTIEQRMSKEHLFYNTKCPASLQVHPAYFWGYVYFRQVKDITLPRGYFQKSVVILTRLPFNKLFVKLSSVIAPEYFENGESSLEIACRDIDKWPPPVPGQMLSLPLLGSQVQTCIPSSNTLTHSSTGSNSLSVSSIRSAPSPLILSSVADVNMFDTLVPVLSYIQILWEIVLTAEPLVVMGSSPTTCSSMVLALIRMIAPLKYCADHRPYFTIHDSEFKEFTSKTHGPPPVMLGVTNPFFAKTLHHWPHTIRLGDLGSSPKQKLKKITNTKVLDTSPGFYSSYKPFLQKDKAVIKKLMMGVSLKRPSEVQSALLKRHLLELTQSFMIPLERYIASLMPLQKNISPFKAAPTPQPFNPDDFLATLETAGPQLTSGAKGDWIGLYRKFFRCPNFNGWFNARYTELIMKLQALHLQTLSDADLKMWVIGKPEVEVVDMVLKIKNKLNKSKEHDMPLSEETRSQLAQRLEDIMCTLPDDLKKLLQIS